MWQQKNNGNDYPFGCVNNLVYLKTPRDCVYVHVCMRMFRLAGVWELYGDGDVFDSVLVHSTFARVEKSVEGI